MEEFCESTTTDETPLEDYLLADKCELIIDVKLRKVPKAIIEAQMIKLAALKKQVHSLRIKNESLKAENQAMKKNIERYYELVLLAREKKKIKGSQNLSTYTISAGIILACTVHLNLPFDQENNSGRKLLFFSLSKNSVMIVYFFILLGFLMLTFVKKVKYDLI